MKRSSMKKIALVTLDYPPQQGGVARYLWNLAKALGEATVTVFVDRTHPVSVDAPAEKVRLFAPGPFGWWMSIIQIWLMRSRGFEGVMVSHVLPLGDRGSHRSLPRRIAIHRIIARLRRSAWPKRPR
jgi:glycosyltransferase involved in cell wall biosynthesis